MLRVFCDHALVAEYPPDHSVQLAGDPGEEALEVLTPAGKVIARHEPGTWHGSGVGIACASLDDRADCHACHPPSP